MFRAFFRNPYMMRLRDTFAEVMKVWMFVSNSRRCDARVLREARTLAEVGHDV
jgi:hypothetical protein